MGRSGWKHFVLMTAAVFAAGCGTVVTDAVATRDVQRPTANVPETGKAKVSWETEKDGMFAKYLQNNSGGMIRKAAVGIEKSGDLKVEISPAVEPEDTLPLTKSLMSGARKDFPDRTINLSVYDPEGAPILKARYRPGEGVHYEVAHGKGSARVEPTIPHKTGDPLARGGVTERDQAFAAWATEHGRTMLRYVEADLEKHGRLWFGVTREVQPADVPPLAKSLLEGARKEFSNKDLVATVFDPEGERIGRARLGSDGEVHWEK